MFATVIIILPSIYGGGEVRVKHGSASQTFEFPSFSTSALAWYTDVMHEVRPVTSGHRLALSYNLIAEMVAKSI
jgi:predicted 2-oxoglutarate/Fe(II)-dependent dioxygenase YbiX